MSFAASEKKKKMGSGLSCFGQSAGGGCFGEPKQKKAQVEQQEVKCSTLEEWLTASPTQNPNNNGGEFVVFRHSLKKIHPFISGPDNPRDGDKLVDDDHHREVDDSSICRSLREKSKKKVSFRLPEEADVFVFYSPDEQTLENH